MLYKKILCIGVLASLNAFSYAQKAKINEAGRELDNATKAQVLQKTDEETAALQKAKAAIDAAVANPDTKDNAKAWYTKAAVYIAMQENESLKTGNPYAAGVEALKKCFALDKKYATDPESVPVIIRGAYYAFNDGVNAYNSSQFEPSLKAMGDALFLLGPDKDKRFSAQPAADTIRAQAKMISGYDAFYSGKNEDAIAFLKEASQSPYLGNQPNVYLVLAQAYEKAGNKEQQLAVLEEGKKKYPAEENLANAELNYYITSGKQDEAIKKLEDAVAKDPNNPDLIFNLGIVYDGIAHPKGGKAPVNAADYSQKAEDALQKALALAPEKSSYNFQLGAHYYNQAAEINTVMNNMEDQAKYNALLKQRDGLFAKALPLLEKSKSLYAAEGKLSAEDRNLYVQNLQALAKIYAIQNKLDEAKAVTDTLNNLQ